jgi:hypothetical protein
MTKQTSHGEGYSLTRMVDPLVDQIVDALTGSPMPHQVVVGPLRWRPDNNGSPDWYFVCASSGDRDGFFTITVRLGKEQEEDLEAVFWISSNEVWRSAAIVELEKRRPPIIVHDMDDELAMARLWEEIWPGPKTREERAGIEAEFRRPKVFEFFYPSRRPPRLL